VILLTEPTVGSDLKALKSIIENDKLNGQKAMITNDRESGLYALLVR
jgi:alkylation response protein AidB-like acyl-CoA dehydrogenase